MMEMSREKVFCYLLIGIFCISQIIGNLLSTDIPIIDRLLLVILCIYGFLLVYEFIFKKTMSVTGLIIPYGKKTNLRSFLFILGCAALVYGYKALYAGVAILKRRIIWGN